MRITSLHGGPSSSVNRTRPPAACAWAFLAISETAVAMRTCAYASMPSAAPISRER